MNPREYIDPGDVATDQGDMHRWVVADIRPMIEASVEVGEVNSERWPHADYDIETAVQAAFGMAFWFAIDQSMRGTSDDLDSRARALTEIVMHGVATRETTEGARPDRGEPWKGS